MSNVQILEINGRPAFAVLPYEDYLELLRRAGNEEHTDAADIAAAQADDGERNLPLEVGERIVVGGENPLRVIRSFRGISAEQLAEELGVSPSRIYMMEQGKRGLSARALKKAAHLLQVDMDDLR